MTEEDPIISWVLNHQWRDITKELYKLAGNSIVVSCMYHIFGKLFVDTESEDGQLTIF